MAERGLHIGVDARELLGRPTGVGRYLDGILRAWLETPDWPHRLTLFAPPDAAGVPDLGPRVNWRTVPGRGSGTWWEQVHLPGAVRAAGVEVLFAPAYTAPLRLRCPSVLAVYDVSFFAHPEWFRPLEGFRRRRITRRAAHQAARVVTISEFSAAEVGRWLGLQRERIVLAPPGAPAWQPSRAAGPREPLVLYVGSLFNRRHIPDLIDGFARLVRTVPDARLVLVGDNRTTPPLDPLAYARQAGVADRVTWTRYVDDAALRELYARARAFAFLSDYEGFGMTPLEALAYGVPPVLLDTPVSREIYGDAALLVDGSPGAVAAALAHLIHDDTAHADRVEAGRALLARYRWSDAAARIRAALEEAVR